MVKRIYENRFFPLGVLALYVALVGIGVYLMDHFSKHELTEMLKQWVPWSLKVNALMIVLAAIGCRRDLWAVAKRFYNRRGLLPALMFIGVVAVTAWVAPRTHRIYYDEDIYGNVAQNMAEKGVTGYCDYGTFEYGEYQPHWVSYNKEPSGWPYLISLGFQLFGTDEDYAFSLNNLLLGAGVWVVFFIVWQVTGAFFPSCIGALAFALIPHNLIWGNTAAAEISAAFFAGLVVLMTVLFFNTRQTRHLLLLGLVLPLACQMRPESGLIACWLAVALLVMSPSLLRERRFYMIGLLTGIFLLPHAIHVYGVSGQSWGAQGSKFSLEFLGSHLETNGLFYLNNTYFPVVTTLLAVMGLLCAGRHFKWRLLFFIWFVLFWGIFLFFYAGSYTYGADVRFALVSFMPLAVLAGMGGGWLREWIMKRFTGRRTGTAADKRGSEKGALKAVLSVGIGVVMLFSFLKFVPLVRLVGQEAWGSRHDHQYAREFIDLIPQRSIVLTHTPTMLLLWGQSAIQTHAGINHPGLIKDLLRKYNGHVYFHDNYWCNTQSLSSRRLCRRIRDQYDLTEVARAREQDYHYGLYRMGLKD